MITVKRDSNQNTPPGSPATSRLRVARKCINYFVKLCKRDCYIHCCDCFWVTIDTCASYPLYISLCGKFILCFRFLHGYCFFSFFYFCFMLCFSCQDALLHQIANSNKFWNDTIPLSFIQRMSFLFVTVIHIVVFSFFSCMNIGTQMLHCILLFQVTKHKTRM